MSNQEDNIFKILRVQDKEIQHSNFLAWLFRLKIDGENRFLKYFLQDLHQHLENDPSYPKILESFSKKDPKVTVEREKDYIDILIYNSEFVICIENKWGASESEGQLDRYYNYVEKNYSDRDIRKYVFLTLKNKEPKSDRWQPYNYGSLKEQIDKLLNSISEKKELEKESIYIKDYLDIFEKKEKYTTKQIEFFEELEKQLRKNGFSDISSKGSSGIFFMPNGFEEFPCNNKRSSIGDRSLRNFACSLSVNKENHLIIDIVLFKCDLKNKDDSTEIESAQNFYKKIENYLKELDNNKDREIMIKKGGEFGRWTIGKESLHKDFLNEYFQWDDKTREEKVINIIEKIEQFLIKYNDLFEKLKKLIPLSS